MGENHQYFTTIWENILDFFQAWKKRIQVYSGSWSIPKVSACDNLNMVIGHHLSSSLGFIVQKTCFEIRSTMHSWMKLIVDLHSPEPK